MTSVTDECIPPNVHNMSILAQTDRLSVCKINREASCVEDVRGALSKAVPSLPLFFDICSSTRTGDLTVGKYNCANLPENYHNLDLIMTPIVGDHKKRKMLIIQAAEMQMGNCCICQHEMPVKDYFMELRKLICCGNTFHTKCVNEWFEIKKRENGQISCPLCKEVVQETLI